MNIIIRRHQTDKDYLEFYETGGLCESSSLFTMHEECVYGAVEFMEAIKIDIEEHGEARVKMVHFEREPK